MRLHTHLWESKVNWDGLGYVQEPSISGDRHREPVQRLKRKIWEQSFFDLFLSFSFVSFCFFFFLAFLSFLSVSCFFPGTENVASRLPPWSLPDPSPPALSFRNAAFESSSQFYLFAATFCHCDFTRSFFLFSFFDSFYLIYKRFPINDEIIRMKISKRLERIPTWILRLFLQSTFLNLKINQLITFFLYFFYRYVIRKQREENANCTLTWRIWVPWCTSKWSIAADADDLTRFAPGIRNVARYWRRWYTSIIHLNGLGST